MRAGLIQVAFAAAGAAAPTISDVTPSTVTPSSNPVITGTNFEATQGTGVVTISPTDDVDDVNAEAQTIGTWGGDTSITLTGVTFPTGTTHNDTLYLFVTNDSGETNASGYALTADFAPNIDTGTITAPTSGGFQVQFNTDIGNGTAYYVVYDTGSADPTALQIVAGLHGGGVAAIASGSQAVVASGTQTFSPAVTGLTQGTTYRVAVVHYGDSSV
jgi:hypothetical protein